MHDCSQWRLLRRLQQNAPPNDKNCPMSNAASIFGEVESALHGAPGEKRVEVLRRVTDLFVGQSDLISEEQSNLFGGVLNQLIKNIEDRAVAELSARVAPLPNAPCETVRALARHDNIEISGPILTQSSRLTDNDLIEIATTKSQAHLARIAGRNSLNAKVTDVLVDNGNSDVANTLAQNSGARFSNIGMAKLVMRSDGDDRLTELLGCRTDIPPHHFQNLLAHATAAVRQKLLQSASPERQHAIQSVLTNISAQIAPQPVTTARYLEAERLMKNFSQDTELLKAKIFEFAVKKRLAEAIVGLSILSGVPVDDIDRLFSNSNAIGLMAVCRSVMLDWQSAWAVIMTSAAAASFQADLDALHEQYETLTPQSAQRLLRFWQTRQKVGRPGAAAMPTHTVQ
jgi:uncharacterized protein (DUF2336 family)